VSRPQKHHFIPQNPEKYTGRYPIVSRSSWEWDMMNIFDSLTTVIEWASEPVQIPYRDPVTGLQKIYIPDFLVTFMVNREPVKQLIEVKPIKEAVRMAARTREDHALVARNNAKWECAIAWCMRRGIEFKVMDETQGFSGQALSRGGTMIPSWTPAHIKQVKNTPIKPRIAKAPSVGRVQSLKVPRIGKIARIRGVSKIKRI